MKKIEIIFALLLLTTINVFAQEINWMTLEEAIALQKENPKKIMMDAYTNWCGPCKLLDKKTFHNKDVVEYVNKYYYAVKFNAEGNEDINFNGKHFANPNYDASRANKRNAQHELAVYFRIQAYPTIVFLNENEELIAPITGYKQPQELELYLKMFKNDDHKNLKSQDAFNDYYAAFKAEFQQ
jgi:thioredoxin-related protein